MTPLYPYQEIGVLKLESTGGRGLLGDEQGLGKSIQSLAWYRRYLYPAGPAVIVCPATVKWNWANEASKHLNLRAEILETTRPPRINSGFISKRCVLIINYDILYAWVRWLLHLEPQLVIGDEVQKICNMQARCTRAFHRLCKPVPHVLALSGTAMKNRPIELFSACHVLWPEEFPSMLDFGWKYCQPEKVFGVWKFKGAANLPHLNKKLNRLGMVRRLKKDVLKDLPAKTRTIIPVDIKDRGQYQKAMTNFFAWLKTYEPGKSPSERAEKLVQIGYLKRLAARLKMGSVIDWIEDFLMATDGKLIVFGIHKKILRPLHERFPASVLLDGEVVGKDRQKMIDQFSHDKRIRIMFGNIVAAGVGWNGTAANTVAFAELTWDPASHTQAEDRIHRIGQKNAANVYYLVARNTIETVLCAILQKKQRILDQVLDGGIDRGGLSVFNELFERMASISNTPEEK